MELLGWLLAAGFAILSWVFWRRSRVSGSLEKTQRTRPHAIAWQDDVQDTTLQAAAGFLNRTVVQDLKQLRQGLASDSPLLEPLDQAVQAVEDFAFYAAAPSEESLTDEDLATVVQEGVREYTKQTRVPVRVHPSPAPIQVRVRRDALKDAVFMLLTNAGLYSGGRPIDVHLEGHSPRGFAIHIRDEGPGFSSEALERAIEPFWSTDSRGIGLGLPFARRRVALLKGELSLKNQPSGGGEVSLFFPEGVVPSAQ